MTDANVSSLQADVEAAARPIGPRCSVQDLIAALSPVDAAYFLQAIDDRSIYASVIGKVLRAPPRNHEVGDDSLRRHRNKECGCRR